MGAFYLFLYKNDIKASQESLVSLSYEIKNILRERPQERSKSKPVTPNLSSNEVQKFYSMFSTEENIERTRAMLMSKLSEQDKEEQNILHMIEESGDIPNPSATISSLHQIRKERRGIKELLSVLQSKSDKIKKVKNKKDNPVKAELAIE